MISLFFLICLTLFLISSFYLISVLRGLGQWNRTYYELRNRYGGKQGPGGVMYGYFLTTPTLMFAYGRTFCWLKSRRRWFLVGPGTTELKMNWPQAAVWLSVDSGGPRLTPDTWLQSVIQTGDFAFDNSFFARGRRDRQAEKLLSGDVRQRIRELDRLDPAGGLSIRLQRNVLLISKPGFIRDYRRLDDFLRLSLELFDQLMLVYQPGVDFIETIEAIPSSSAKCPVCIGELTASIAVCRRCKTRHCLECWEYNGQCATFGCHETTFDRISAPRK